MVIRVPLILLCLLISLSFSSQSQPDGPLEIQALMSNGDLAAARAKIDQDLTDLRANSAFDDMAHYVYVLGFLEMRESDSTEMPQSDAMFTEVEPKINSPYSYHVLRIGKARLEIERANLSLAYQLAEKAMESAFESGDIEAQVTSQYYLADCCLKLGDIECMEAHSRLAMKLIIANQESSYSAAPKIWNLMGVLMYFSSKPDSARYYYEKALSDTDLLPDLPENQLYLPAMYSGNLSYIYYNQGDFIRAMELVQSSIKLNKEFLDVTKNHPLNERAQQNLAVGYSSLSAFYSDMGDYIQAQKIIELQYHFSKDNLVPCGNSYTKAILNRSDIAAAQMNLEEAENYLIEAEEVMATCEDNDLMTRAHFYQSYGALHYRKHEYLLSIPYYQKADSCYELSFPGEYSWNRYYLSLNLALSLSDAGKGDEALSKMDELYAYFTQSEDDSEFFVQSILYNLCRITYDQGEYESCVEWGKESLKRYDVSQESLSTSAEMASFEMDIAKIIMLMSKAEYQIKESHSESELMALLERMRRGMDVLETRKSILSSSENISLFIEQNTEVFDFVKVLYRDLYELTQEKDYLYKLISLHESAMYNKIRSRLNIRSSMAFSGVPQDVMSREVFLRKNLNGNLDEENISEFNENINEWRTFLDSLKADYPKYYGMRYAAIETPVNDIHSKLSKNTSVIRYIMVDGKTYAYVMSSKGEFMIELNFDPESDKVKVLSENLFNSKKSSLLLFELYQDIWKPIEDKLEGDNVIVIPDGVLHNLSFESLLSKDPSSAKEPWKSALLFKYLFSYNYSLFLLANDSSGDLEEFKNMAVFVPEFNDEMKNIYSSKVSDSEAIDKDYLALIPQPFALSLAKDLAERFTSSVFLHGECTEKNFIKNAGGSQIIFIGTHAEANNVSPELSRFIFAKDQEPEDNYLYNYEIYGCDLRSELAVLTACETGRPSFQPGEGMVSLAHAFNYAGSKSLLSSLWKIDEKTSASQVSSFYEYLSEGLPKHEALNKAKRDYLDHEVGERLAPGYWSGLVLMGDVSPVTLNSGRLSTPILVVLILIGLVLLVFGSKWFLKNSKS